MSLLALMRLFLAIRLARRSRALLEKIELLSDRQVMALRVCARGVEETVMTPVSVRADAGKFREVANQMRLIEVAALGR